MSDLAPLLRRPHDGPSSIARTLAHELSLKLEIKDCPTAPLREAGRELNLQSPLELYITWIMGTLNQASGLLNQGFMPAGWWVRDTLMVMLNWKRDADGWRSNGYKIRLVAPYHWELLDSQTADGPIIAEHPPLATTRTLTECKREAERLEISRRLDEIRRRNWALLVVALAGFAFVPSFAPPGDLLAVIVLLVLASRAIGLLAGSYMARSHVSVHDLFYQ